MDSGALDEVQIASCRMIILRGKDMLVHARRHSFQSIISIRLKPSVLVADLLCFELFPRFVKLFGF